MSASACRYHVHNVACVQYIYLPSRNAQKKNECHYHARSVIHGKECNISIACLRKSFHIIVSLKPYDGTCYIQAF